MNDQQIKFCPTCFSAFHYERSTKIYCSDLCRVTDFNKKEATKRREEILYSLCKGSEEIAFETIVEDAPDIDIAADTNTPLMTEQENSIPLSVTVEEQHAKFIDKLNENRRRKTGFLHKTELNWWAKIIYSVSDSLQGSNN